jgi:transcriptional regulator with XRE-family HTH domain
MSSYPFAELLQRYRLAAGLTQHALARAAGIDPTYVSRLERADRAPPRREVVDGLAAALGLEPRDRERLALAAGYAPVWLAALAADARLVARREHGGTA